MRRGPINRQVRVKQWNTRKHMKVSSTSTLRIWKSANEISTVASLWNTHLRCSCASDRLHDVESLVHLQNYSTSEVPDWLSSLWTQSPTEGHGTAKPLPSLGEKKRHTMNFVMLDVNLMTLIDHWQWASCHSSVVSPAALDFYVGNFPGGHPTTSLVMHYLALGFFWGVLNLCHTILVYLL